MVRKKNKGSKTVWLGPKNQETIALPTRKRRRRLFREKRRTKTVGENSTQNYPPLGRKPP